MRDGRLCEWAVACIIPPGYSRVQPRWRRRFYMTKFLNSINTKCLCCSFSLTWRSFCMEVGSCPSTSLSVGSWNKLGHNIFSFLLACCTIANHEVWVMGWASGHRWRCWGRGRGAWRGWRVAVGEWRGMFWRVDALFSEEPAMSEGGGKQQGLGWQGGQEGFGLARGGEQIFLVVIIKPRR